MTQSVLIILRCAYWNITMDRWVNKVAVVTGASAGIGEATTRALLDKGMIVVGLARRQTYMDTELRASLPEGQRQRFHAIKCDLCLESDIRNAFAYIDEHLGGVHVLINNAGIVRHNVQIVDENNTADLRASIDVNVMGVALCTREAFQSMKRKNFDGHIVFVNSIAGHRVPRSLTLDMNIYPATKFAVTAMVEVLRQEFLQHQTKIKVTSICPGPCDSNIVGGYNTFAMEFPILECKDVADAIVYCIQTPPNVQIREIIVEPLGSQF